MQLYCLFLIMVISLSIFEQVISHTKRETYIVHVRNPEKSENIESWYDSFLVDTNGRSVMGHKYRHVISGFSAELSADEVREMEMMEGFLHARPQKVYTLQTTESPNFLGLFKDVGSWPASNYGKGVIIGIVDSGIALGHPSFRDEGVPPSPARWRGKCELNGGKGCNNKVIGARSFVWSDVGGQAVDGDGHGSHTASTAAGNFIPGANAVGQANGTASGMAPLAHLAIYKVCQSTLCFESDVLAGMDAAVEDGVDVLSMSIGGSSFPYYIDGLSIGAFAAMRKGILVSCAANNNGPKSFSLANDAPWILTVGATTIDRQIVAKVLLGNQDEFDGQSVYQPSNFVPTLLPLVYAGDLGNTTLEPWPGSLDNADVRGKVVLCIRGGGASRITKGQTVKDAGGAAMILMNDIPDAYSTLADAHVLPVSHVSYAAGDKIRSYIKNSNTTTPTATILFQGTKLGDKTAPMLASYSSRGPSLESPGILKPDIVGPGSSILAAWPGTGHVGYSFNIISGTSMACPHLSGIAALVKEVHPHWSPAMIKSALMTSADDTPILDENYEPAGVFAIGAGQVNPSKAIHPGLVYDLSTTDYISYLCHIYTQEQVQLIANQEKINCNVSMHEAQLNYPSFAIQLGNTTQEYSRIVTNVGDAKSRYHVQTENIWGVNMVVRPDELVFSDVNQRLEYRVSFSRQEVASATNGSYVQGSIAWVSSQHTVRIPVSVHLVLTDEQPLF